MNMRREAILWIITIVVSIVLGLVVVWAAIALAFNRPNLAPLYFSASPYRQDDYSPEGVNAARLNPLDPGLEQEAMLEDQARNSLVSNVNYDLKAVDQVSSKATPPAPTNTSQRPAPTDTSQPMPTNTHLVMPTNTPLPVSTNTSAPAPTNTSLPAPTSTSLPTATNTSRVPKTPRRPPGTRRPPKTKHPPNMPQPPHPLT